MARTPHSVPLLTDFSPVSGVVYNEPRKLSSHNSVRVDLLYDTTKCDKNAAFNPADQRQKLLIQTPIVSRAFPKEWNNQDAGGNTTTKWELGLSMRGYENSDSKVSGFYKWLEGFETRTKDQAVTNCTQWFKKTMTREVINAYYTSCVKQSSDPDRYPPTVKVNVPYRYGKFECDIFGPGGKSEPMTFMEFQEVAKQSEVMAIIEFESVWFMPKGFGCTPILRALQVFPEDKLSGYNFNLSVLPEERRKDVEVADAEAFQDSKRQKLADTNTNEERPPEVTQENGAPPAVEVSA